MRPGLRRLGDRWAVPCLFVAFGLTVGGCGTLSAALKTEARLAEDAVPSVDASSSSSGAIADPRLPAVSPAAIAAEAAAPACEVASRASGSETGEDRAVPDDAIVTVACDAPADAAACPAARRTVAAASAPAEPASGFAMAAGAVNEVLAQAGAADRSAVADVEAEQYDPWESFNETMFEFNRRLDRYVLKPAARVYKAVVPEPFQVVISNGLDNIRWVPRFVNSVLQGKYGGAGREVARFLINSTAGIGGLFDPARDYWHIKASEEDFGQTLGVWGYGPGPYLVLPLMAPMTVRDGIGRGVDMVLDPLSYFVPFLPDRLAMKVGDTVNDRALNYDLFQGVEETTLDLYTSVRHFYLRHREQQIKE